ncbi:MAG: Hsp20/alpha crystallin family protein [Gammaproteobacteria bacterium]|nr:Hsp20/alpha crystallin family protein [Gammaproteobacteria bacterium]
MSHMHRNPLSIFDYMQQEFDKLQASALTRRSDDNSNVVSSDWAPAVDIKEEDKQYLIKADIPGVKADEIEVNMDNGVLSIKGERESEIKEDREHYKRIERSHGLFYRRFSMPDDANADKISARSTDGVLEIIIPKKESAQPRKIAVTH